ncbi:SAM-dependent methyltransferase [Amycolatopsis sp. NPDC004378]
MVPDDDTAPVAPAGVDTTKPSAARIYDWYLGGDHNWAVDREFGKKAVQHWPGMPAMARQNRAFMNRVVEAALDAGIRQFLDLGSGVPTVGNVHEIIRNRAPDHDATVVYVDYEPVAAAHSTLILEKDEATDWAGIVQHDLRDPDAIFDDDTTHALIDFDEPVCVLLIAVMHFIGPHDHPGTIVETYRSHAAPGSWLAISHASIDDAPENKETAGVRDMIATYQKTSNPMWLRDRAEFTPWFGDWHLLEPGITRLPHWRPDHEPWPDELSASSYGWGGVAAKPAP